MFRPGSQVSWYEWILPISSWDFTIRTFICPFFSTFSVIIQWRHDIFCHTSWYELLGPWPICPPSFIEISSKMSEFDPSLTTIAAITITTRGTVPWGTVNPIPIRLVTGTKDKVSPGNSRWQQLAPFERASVTSYSTLMVTMDLCASVSKLQPSEICLKCAWPRFDLWRSL